MTSNVLPQAFFMVPRNPILQRGQNKLAFSAFVSRRPSAFGFSISKASCNSFGFEKLKRRTFVVRAEETAAEAEQVSVENAAEEVVEDAPPEAAAAAETSGDGDGELEGEAEEKAPRKPRIKLGDIMGILNKRAIEASDETRPTPDLRTGDIVEIKLEVPENRRRLSIYKGIVISRQNAGIHTTIRIRRIIAGVGVEIVFPLYSPNIKEIKVVKHRKVRRARLYYLRDKLPRLSTFK